jgi:SBP domain
MKSMVLQGRRQRFCQQCGRFHDVTEFEGTRKSCRRKLARHNQRRRSVPTKGCAWQSESEEDFIDVTEDAEYQALANMKRGERARSARLNSLHAPLPSNNTRSNAAESPSCSMDRRYHSPMDLDHPSVHNIAGFVPLTHEGQAAGGSSGALKEMQQQPLSSSDGGAVTREGLLLGVDGAGSARNSPDPRLRGVRGSTTAIPSLQNFAAPGGGLPAPPMPRAGTPFGALKDAPFFNEILDDDILGGLLMFPDDISDSLVVSQHDQLSNGADGSVGIERQAPGCNAAAAVAAATATVVADERNWFGALGELNSATSPRQGALETAHRRQQQEQQQPTYETHSLYHHHQQRQHHQQQHPAATAAQPTALEAASSMVSMDAPALVGYSVDNSMLRLSIKLFNCTPDMLAPQVKSELTSLLRVAEQSLVEGYIRPGCMHVTLSVRVPTHAVSISNDINGSVDGSDTNGAVRGHLVAAVERLLDSTVLTSEAKDCIVVQLHDELVVVKQNRVMAAIDMGKSMGLIPHIAAVRPLAVLAAANGMGRTAVMLAGRRLNGPSSLIMCRQGGRNLAIELPDDEGDDENTDTLAVGQVINIGVLGIAAGCAEFEVQVGSFLGPAKPLVALPDAACVEEVRQLENLQNGFANNLPVDSFLRDLGLVAQYLDRENAEEEDRPVPTYTPELLATIQKIACKLVAAALSRKWIALTAYLLPATTAADQSKEDAVAIMDAACPRGSTLLHVAVGTGSLEIVLKLAQWAAESASSPTTSAATAGPFAVDAKGLGGVTPLHVAAMLPPKLCYAMRHELTIMSSAAPKLWGLAQSDDGITPEGLADMVAGGGGSSGSGVPFSRTNVPTYIKPTPFSVSSVNTTENESIKAGPLLESVMEKIGSRVSLLEAGFSRNMSWKSRADVKTHFVDHHIGNMMDEVRSLNNSTSQSSDSVSVWDVGVVLGSAMALALGTAAMALHLA